MKTKSLALLNTTSPAPTARPQASALREALMTGVREASLRDRLLDEFHDLAGAVRGVLELAERYELQAALSAEDRRLYGALMAKIQRVGVRGRALAEESVQAEQAASLAVAVAPSSRLN